jgi:hypothetical protein
MDDPNWFTEKNYNKTKKENNTLIYRIDLIKSSCLFPQSFKDRLIRKYIKQIKKNTVYFENLYNFLYIFNMPFYDTQKIPDYLFRTQLNEDFINFNRIIAEYTLTEPILSQSNISISMFQPATYENNQSPGVSHYNPTNENVYELQYNDQYINTHGTYYGDQYYSQNNTQYLYNNTDYSDAQ